MTRRPLLGAALLVTATAWHATALTLNEAEEKALAANPESDEAHASFGAALANTGKLEEALPHYRRALELNPNLADAHMLLAWLLATIQTRQR